MLGTILLCVACILILGFILFICIWKIRTRKFKPSKDKTGQQQQLNQDLKDAGFAYDLKNDLFYSVMDCWQREMGYCRLYDEGSADFNMVMHCEPVCFTYNGKRWMIELWKGQYGITTGAEIGIYNTASDDIKTKQFTGTYYDCASDDERLDMSFVPVSYTHLQSTRLYKPRRGNDCFCGDTEHFNPRGRKDLDDTDHSHIVPVSYTHLLCSGPFLQESVYRSRLSYAYTACNPQAAAGFQAFSKHCVAVHSYSAGALGNFHDTHFCPAGYGIGGYESVLFLLYEICR